MNRRVRTRLAVLAVHTLAVTAIGAWLPAQARAGTLDVATTGSDANAGTAASPLRTVQAAIDRATPGTTIRIHAGTYKQQLRISRSGIAGAPITVTNAGDGPVTLTSDQVPDSCDAHQPSPRRTLRITAGADYWTFKGLTIVHGAYINGKGAGAAFTFHANNVKSGNWQARRAVPGASTNDPVAARDAAAYLAKVTGTAMDPSEHIEFIGNRITSRGIYATLANYGVLKDNTISDIICGSGPGVWVMTFSNFWEISGNDVSRIAPSGLRHYMQEGIRVDSGAGYAHVYGNYVHDLSGDGRAFNTDEDASFNIYEDNRAANVAIAYNDQMAGWGNIWRNNVATGYRQYCFGFRLKDASMALPSPNSSTNMASVSGNTCSAPATTGAKGVGIGAISKSTFSGNTFPGVMLGKYVAGYWAKYGNMWNGSSVPPSTR